MRIPFDKSFFGTMIIGFCALYSSCALLLFEKQIPSFFVYTTHASVTPWYMWGAALLIYYFGGAAWIVCGALWISTWWVAQKKSFLYESDRIIAFCCLIAATAGLLSLFRVDSVQSFAPGGVIGITVAQFFVAQWGLFLAKQFLLVVCCAACVVITQWCWLPLVRVGITWSEFVYRFAVERKVVQRFGYACLSFVTLLSKHVKQFARMMYNLFMGRSLHDAGMTVPDDAEQKFNELKAFAQMLKQSDAKLIFDQKTFSIPSTKVEQPHDFFEESHKQEQRFENKIQSDDEYQLPALDMFVASKAGMLTTEKTKMLEQKAQILEEKLQRFGVAGSVTDIKCGPVVTLYEYEPDIDIKISKIIALEDDLALALQALSIRIIAPIPGRSVVGFEVANQKRDAVLLSDVLHSKEFQSPAAALPLALGVDTVGTSVIVDLARMPHLLIAGSTGSGKSVALNGMLTSLLCRCTPDELKLVLIDPKRLEFSVYADVPHLLFPIVTDPRRAAPILRWVVTQMEQRYELMAEHGVRTVKDYNEQIAKGALHAEPVPFIVVVIDELSDLMMTSGKDVEDSIARIAQMARAAGIHLIVATQRPSVDVITGLIKVNFPSRISFRVTSKVDSRTILDTGGAEKLLGKGDLLFLDSTMASLRRLHGAYVSDAEIHLLVDRIKRERSVEYLDITQELMTLDEVVSDGDSVLYQQILAYIETVDEISISLLQREFRIGYNRSARIIDQLEKQGRLMPPEGGKMRKVVR